ncbi:S-protein homolog 5-like [Abrus precatorius]|uniref:S-protein homolog n=1 Tax=Abrus precatorius TaxID=3816 RepID=A0A8B8KH55_ABRPR|nr:S-protein homolog 5-like [Abrus precatorius]
MLKGLAVLLMIIAADTLTVGVHARKHVRVTNLLGKDAVLYLHCRSRDDDLGLHVLRFLQFQEWSFNNNIGGTTLFWCSLQWNDKQRSIEVYNYERDNKDCSSYCWRFLEPDGAYFYIENTRQWEHRYSW